MKAVIEREMRSFVGSYPQVRQTETTWKEPLAAYAAADDPMFETFKKTVSPTHSTPRELMKDARTVISYFLPFDSGIAKDNIEGDMCSRSWALAYVETNALIIALNRHVAAILEKTGYDTVLLPPTHNFDTTKLVSDWSHKHVAHVAGLGTFGIHTMIITEKGCCGRLGSIITSAELEPTERPEHEFCLAFYDGSCKKCIEKCAVGALTVDGLDRRKCYDVLLKNMKIHEELGRADACGKCVSIVPCSYTNPVEKQERRKSKRT
ncbi:MAG TPA: epoxyqueuosine reductase [Deltaproteobacteria bacterium]|nr:epoxyqueuosine reductase [Deltaproteobacteria bacterium]